MPSVRTTISVTLSIAFLLALTSSVAANGGPKATHPPIFPLVTRWSIEIAGPPVAGASPIVDEQHVYVALRAGQIVAHDLTDGRERWRHKVAAAHPMAVEANLVFAATEETIHALRASDGALAWEAPAKTTAPLLARAGWVIALADGKALALRAADGTRVWERDVGAATERPAIDGDQLYISLDDGRIIALQMSSGDLIWERRLGGVAQAPLVTGDRVYAGAADKQFYCLNARNGEIEYQRRVGAAPQGPAAADTSHVFAATLDNMLRAYARGSGNQRWLHPLKRRPSTGPFVVGSAVLIASSSSAEIWAWTTSGKPAGTIATPAEPAVPPEFVDRGAEGAFILVVTGGLTNQWQLTLLGTAGDPPLQPLGGLPGDVIDQPLMVLPGEVIELRR